MKHLANQRGDTLVEVIFSLIILTAVLVSVFSLGRQARGQSSNARTRIQAVDMTQEQYEALRGYRDRQPDWASFLGGGFIAGSRAGIARRHDSPSSCDPVADCFHMERQSNPSLPDYGQWVPCPGQWFPPLDYDAIWSTPANPTPTQRGYAYYTAFYGTYGCQGNARTHSDQPIIQVGIIAEAASTPGVPNCDYYYLVVSTNWPTAGSRAGGQATSDIFSYIANVKGVDHVSPCP